MTARGGAGPAWGDAGFCLLARLDFTALGRTPPLRLTGRAEKGPGSWGEMANQPPAAKLAKPARSQSKRAGVHGFTRTTASASDPTGLPLMWAVLSEGPARQMPGTARRPGL